MKFENLIVLGSMALLFALSCTAEAQGQSDRNKDKYAIIDCWGKKFITVGEENAYTNRVWEEKKIKWNAFGPENTVVKIVFAADPNFPSCKGTSPDDDPNPKTDTIGSSEHVKMELKVKQGKGGAVDKECYVYKIYCNADMVAEEQMAPAQTSSIIDPIIEVPKP